MSELYFEIRNTTQKSELFRFYGNTLFIHIEEKFEMGILSMLKQCNAILTGIIEWDKWFFYLIGLICFFVMLKCSYIQAHVYANKPVRSSENKIACRHKTQD